MNEPSIEDLVATVAQALERRGWFMATAESCTGGLIAARCTDRAGSSAWFERGFVTYSNEAKTEMLEVSSALIARDGAVSASVAQAMAEGALRHSRAQVAVAVTGIAGPGGAVPGKPVGTVWLGWAWRAGLLDTASGASGAPLGNTAGSSSDSAPPHSLQSGTRLLQLTGDRAAVRQATVVAALNQVLKLATA